MTSRARLPGGFRGDDAHPTDRTPGDDDDAERRDMTRRFWIGLAISVPLLVQAASMEQHP